MYGFQLTIFSFVQELFANSIYRLRAKLNVKLYTGCSEILSGIEARNP